MITPEILKKVAPTLSKEKSVVITDAINNICPVYGISEPNILHEFLATILHESGEFKVNEEDLSNYRAPRMAVVWPTRFAIKDARGKPIKPYKPNELAFNLQKKPIEIANSVYGGRMGNDTLNDGWTFRGRGFIQLTGKESYFSYFNFKKSGGGYAFEENPKTIEELLKLLLRDDWSIDSACWEFAIDKKLIQAAANNDFKTVTKRINGGFIGYKDRVRYYELCKRYIV